MEKKEREALKKQIIANFLKFIESREDLKDNDSVKEAYLKLKQDIL